MSNKKVSMPKISIIVPVYKTENYLNACLDSILSQTMQEIEIIIVNDESPDDSLEIIHKYMKHDDRIVLINQKNMGLSGARNSGLRIAKGEYIAFVDSDDTIDLTMMEDLYKNAHKGNYDIVVSLTRRIATHGTSVQPLPKLENDSINNILNPSFSIAIWNKIYKTELFTKHSLEFPTGFNYEDQTISLKLFYYASKIKYVNQAYYNYYYRTDSITTSSLSIKDVRDVFYVIETMELFLKERNIFLQYKPLIIIRLLKLLNVYILPNLIQCKNRDINNALVQFIKKSVLMINDNLESIQKASSENYISFLTYITSLNTVFPNTYDFLLPLLSKNAIFPSKNNNVDNNTLEHQLVKHLKKKCYDNIIIYGVGQIFYNIQPILKENGISINYVMDSNVNSLNNQKSKFTTISKENLKNLPTLYPIVVTSFAFANEINEELHQYAKANKFEIVTITINDLIDVNI